MTWTYQPVAGCGENRKSGFEREDWGATPSSTPTTDGENWKNNQGWDVSSETPPSADDVNDWHGVKVVGFRVTEILLNDNDLSGTLPSELGDLSNLQKLYLYDNSLRGTIPDNIFAPDQLLENPQMPETLFLREAGFLISHKLFFAIGGRSGDDRGSVGATVGKTRAVQNR